MKLIYRGIEYEQAPIAELAEREVALNYRGVQWKRYQSSNALINPHAAELKYRGIGYYSGTPEKVEELKQRKKLNFIFKKSSNLFTRNRPINNDLAETHSTNLCHDLQRRLQLAKLNGDDKLIQMLEDEANQLSFQNCQLSFDDC
ncbi:hypothetical protein NIES267_65760 [Calothrix parasitica NIES-267]|uniref:DUF4278 domain-containing protein n=1 Tax=Calothrix parasitica NIES-267 TaxID=1973488 RepID=A0A1Z4M0S2_9CYAN|nr:hypothetical protein NIES267_65760 [Calothrix parasitica NIES-267]